MNIILVVCLSVLLVFPAVARADIGDEQAQMEKTYGQPALIAGAARLSPTATDSEKPPAASFGYLANFGGRQATLWADYDQSGRVVRETVILDAAITVREFARAFHRRQSQLAGPDSEIFIVRAYPRDELAALVNDAGRTLFIRFFMDSRRDNTRINTHSRIKAFMITAAGPAERSLALMAARETTPGPRDGAWVRVENIFGPGLHFSEKLIPRPDTKLIVIHHTKIPDMTVASIHDLHLRNGWAGIGYHKVILPDGTVADGRPEPMIGAHALGANRESIGIVLVGDFDVGTPTPAQLKSLLALTAELMRKYGLKIDAVVPHRAVTAGTVCPGTRFPWTEFIQRLNAYTKASRP